MGLDMREERGVNYRIRVNYSNKGTISNLKLFRYRSGTRKCVYGLSYGKNDVVGCGWNRVDGKVFFTKNGVYLYFILNILQVLLINLVFDIR